MQQRLHLFFGSHCTTSSHNLYMSKLFLIHHSAHIGATVAHANGSNVEICIGSTDLMLKQIIILISVNDN